MPKRLLVIGAGPKGIAIAAKASVLAKCGYSVPEITIVEKNEIAAHWIGGFGYTDGRQVLETPPEKDIGFPYSSREFEHEIDHEMFRRYSWHAYLLSQRHGGLSRYSEEVDRGEQTRPPLAEWALYIRWVAQECGAQVQSGEVVEIKPSEQHWTLSYIVAGLRRSIEGDALVITGPGPARGIEGQPSNHPRVLDGNKFWNRLGDFANLSSDDDPIGIIGSGGTAASIVIGLARTLRHPVPIFVVNRDTVVFSRGEGYWENSLFSAPEEWNWREIPLGERLAFIERTDRGVFSVAAMSFINRLRTVHHLRMNVKRLEIVQQYEFEPEGRPVIVGENRLPLQFAIVAIGFDPWWFWRLIPDQSVRTLLAFGENQRILLRHVRRDLTFDPRRVPTPPLHVPMLSGVAEGPGFPSLACLGHLADRVLRPYVTKH